MYPDRSERRVSGSRPKKPRSGPHRAMSDEVDIEPAQDSSDYFRYDWIRRHEGVNGFALRARGEAWRVSGEVTESWAEECTFLASRAKRLGRDLEFDPFSSMELVSPSRTALVIAGRGDALVVVSLTNSGQARALLKLLEERQRPGRQPRNERTLP